MYLLLGVIRCYSVRCRWLAHLCSSAWLTRGVWVQWDCWRGDQVAFEGVCRGLCGLTAHLMSQQTSASLSHTLIQPQSWALALAPTQAPRVLQWRQEASRGVIAGELRRWRRLLRRRRQLLVSGRGGHQVLGAAGRGAKAGHGPRGDGARAGGAELGGAGRGAGRHQEAEEAWRGGWRGGQPEQGAELVDLGLRRRHV